MNATSDPGSVVAAAGTFNVQYTKAIHWGFGDEIIHFGSAAASSTFSWAVAG